MAVEHLAVLQRLSCRVADERRRDLIAFPKPKLQHVAATQPSIGDLADHGFFKIDDRLAHGDSVNGKLQHGAARATDPSQLLFYQ